VAVSVPFAENRAWGHVDQRGGITAFKRQVLNVLLPDHLPDRTGLRIDHWRVGLYGDGGLRRGDRKREPDTGGDIGVEIDALMSHRREPAGRDQQVVPARGHKAELEAALGIGCRVAGPAGARIRKVQRGIGDKGRRLVGDTPREAAGGRGLRGRGPRQKNRTSQNCQGQMARMRHR